VTLIPVVPSRHLDTAEPFHQDDRNDPVSIDGQIVAQIDRVGMLMVPPATKVMVSPEARS